MANIIDYLHWRGDLTFKQAEFNEVDNLIFSELVYVDFRNIVPPIGTNKTITLKEASEIFFKQHSEEEIESQIFITRFAAYLLKEMAETTRFKDAELSNYIDDIDLEEQSQFCALTIKLNDGSVFVSYSGTDNTMIGWKENFNMSFLEHTPGQLKAVHYLNRVIPFWQGKVRVGGHSKGGNLAVYASVHGKASIQRKILAIYNNDGPGFTRKLIEGEAYRKMLPKIHTILPKSSIVGLFFEHEDAYEVVESSQSGFLQHDPMSWEVLGNSFVHVKTVTEQSMMLDKTLKAWMNRMSVEEREEFVEVLFAILEEGNIKTLDDFANIKWKKFIELMKLKNTLSQENQEILRKTLKLLWEESKTFLKKVLNNQKSVKM